jgi:acetyltransferase-like isoleucine patch superfamily enzyme
MEMVMVIPNIRNIVRKVCSLFLRRYRFPLGTIVYGDGKNLSIGNNVSFGGRVALFGTAPIQIGNNTMIAMNVVIHTSTHDYNDHPMWRKRIDRPVKIGSHVWIGVGVIILPGVIIEDYAVIGSGSLLTANVPRGAIVVGNPARILKYRDPLSYEREPEIQKWNQSQIVAEGYLNKNCKESGKKQS